MWVLPVAVRFPFYCAIQACGLFAGDWEERTTAAGNVLCSMILLTGAAPYGSNVPIELGADLGLFGLSVVVCLRSDKLWPLPCASLVLLTVLTDIAQLLAHADTWAFGTAQITWELLNDVLLAWATWRAWRRRRAGRAPAGAPAMV